MQSFRLRRIAGAFLPERKGRLWLLGLLGVVLGSLGFALVLRVGHARLAPAINGIPKFDRLPLRSGLASDVRMTASLDGLSLQQALRMYAELTGRTPLPPYGGWSRTLARTTRNEMSEFGLLKPDASLPSGITVHGDGLFTAAEVKVGLEKWFQANGVIIMAQGTNAFRAEVVIAEGRNSNDSEIRDRR